MKTPSLFQSEQPLFSRLQAPQGSINGKTVQAIKPNLQITSRQIKYTAISLTLLALIPMVHAAVDCKRDREICHQTCKLVGPQEGSACFLGCKLAYLTCKIFLEK